MQDWKSFFLFPFLRLQALIQPENLLPTTAPQRPARPDGPASFHPAVPLRVQLDQVPGGVPLLLIQYRGFVAARQESRVTRGGQSLRR